MREEEKTVMDLGLMAVPVVPQGMTATHPAPLLEGFHMRSPEVAWTDHVHHMMISTGELLTSFCVLAQTGKRTGSWTSFGANGHERTNVSLGCAELSDQQPITCGWIHQVTKEAFFCSEI